MFGNFARLRQTPRGWIGGLFIVSIVLFVAVRWTAGLTPQFAGVPVSVSGTFIPDGQFPGEILRSKARVWGSWSGSDENKGAIEIGPFRCDGQVRVAVSGYPLIEGISLYLQKVGTDVRLPVLLTQNVGERWTIVRCNAPEWTGALVKIVAIDDSVSVGGWIGISEPLKVQSTRSFLAVLHGWASSGAVLLVFWLPVTHFCSRLGSVGRMWLPLLGASGVALIGYFLLPVYLMDHRAGKAVWLACFIIALIKALRTPRFHSARQMEVATVGGLVCGITAFHLSVMYLFSSEFDFYSHAALRWGDLPGDNTLPFNVARDLFRGVDLRWADADWLSSDRPPLQSGWMLLTWPALRWLGVDEVTGSGTSSVWFQSLWAAAAYGLFRAFGLEISRACAWTALLALSGFTLLNGVYTWPKLAASAFILGAYGFLCMKRLPLIVTDVLIGAVLLSLGWLSHGSVAFSILSLSVLMIFRMRQIPVKSWLIGFFVVITLVGPWIIYQKAYDPPGNRLLKWHLAGQIDKDDRGTWETIRAGYAAKTIRQLWQDRLANLKVQIAADWDWWLGVGEVDAMSRRVSEFFVPARSLCWWLLALPLLPFAVMRNLEWRLWREHVRATVWVLLTLVWWCGLMYIPGSATANQGSFAMQMMTLVLLSICLERTSPVLRVAIAGLQGWYFLCTWAVKNENIGGPLNWVALACAAVAALRLFTLGWTRGVNFGLGRAFDCIKLLRRRES